MKQSKCTKQAFLMSILAMLLCVTMLVGTTMAWFTDSVTTGKNVIVAGNLDVELQAMRKGIDTEYKTVNAETNLFVNDSPWEPGRVDVIYLKVINKGSLALNYRLGTYSVEEKSGTNVFGKTFWLSNYIKYAVIDGEKTYTTRDEAIADAEAEANKAVAISTPGADTLPVYTQLDLTSGNIVYPEGSDADKPSSKVVTLVVYMPTTVGNEANYRNPNPATREAAVPPTITLGLKLLATQAQFEKDSFGDTYDDNTTGKVEAAENEWIGMTLTQNPGEVTFESPDHKLYVKDADSYVEVEEDTNTEGLYTAADGSGDKYVATDTALNEAAKTGGNVTVLDNIKKTYTSADGAKNLLKLEGEGAEADVDLSDKVITIESYEGKNGIKADEGTKLTLSNGTVKMNKGFGTSEGVVDADKGEITLDNMTVTNDTKSGVCVSAGTDGGLVTIKDSVITGGDGAFNAAVFCSSQSTVVIENSKIVGGIRAGSNSRVELHGGDYTEAILRSENKDRIIIYSGLFSVDPTKDPGESYTHGAKLAPGSVLTDNGDGTWTVTAAG